MVIPAAIRERAGLTAGTELEVTLDDLAIRLVRTVPGPVVVRDKGRLVVRPRVEQGAVPDVDVARLVEEERERWPG